MIKVAEILKTNVNYVYKLRDAGLITCLKLGQWKVTKKELERFNNGGANEELSAFKKLIEKYNKSFNIVKEQLTNSFDATKKKFNYANIKNSNLSILAEASEKVLKFGNTVKYGAITAVSLGLITALATKLKERDN